ncbi:MAG: GTP-binding protein [Thermoplasmata archaeon]|nr:MAG: GTP-binding protein [Thermoplasmata archaeon]
MTEEVNLTLKICFLGDSSVGKTSLIRKYVFDNFDDTYLMTMGTKVSKKTVNVDMPEMDKKFNVTFMIWDIIGDIHFRGLLHHSYLHGAAGALLVCDITRPETLESLCTWVESLNIEGNAEIPIIFMANKCDLKGEQQLSEEDIKKIADVYSSLWLLTSAKTGENVEEVFKILGKKMVEKYCTEIYPSEGQVET